MRLLLIAVACGVALTSSARADHIVSARSLDEFLGTWYFVGEGEVSSTRRVVPVRIEISDVPPSTLGAPRRFRTHLWIRCMDRPSQVCDVGVEEVTPYPGINTDLPIRQGTHSWHSPLEFCQFRMDLLLGQKNTAYYFVGPGTPNCRRNEYADIPRSRGLVSRTAPRRALELPPGAVPERPELPTPTPR